MSSRLLSLPPELRQMIYSHVFGISDLNLQLPPSSSPFLASLRLNLLLTCRLIHSECHGLAFRTVVFRITEDDFLEHNLVEARAKYYGVQPKCTFSEDAYMIFHEVHICSLLQQLSRLHTRLQRLGPDARLAVRRVALTGLCARLCSLEWCPTFEKPNVNFASDTEPIFSSDFGASQLPNVEDVVLRAGLGGHNFNITPEIVFGLVVRFPRLKRIVFKVDDHHENTESHLRYFQYRLQEDLSSTNRIRRIMSFVDSQETAVRDMSTYIYNIGGYIGYVKGVLPMNRAPEFIGEGDVEKMTIRYTHVFVGDENDCRNFLQETWPSKWPSVPEKAGLS